MQSDHISPKTFVTFFSLDPTRIFTSPQNVTKSESQSVTFKCSLEGKPKAEVTWWHGDTKVNTTNNNKYHVSSPSTVYNSEASLTINNLVKGDEGFYRCKVQNDLATVQSEFAYLTVDCEYMYPHKN